MFPVIFLLQIYNDFSGIKWASGLVLVTLSQFPPAANTWGNITLDMEDVSPEAMAVFRGVARHCRTLCCPNNFRHTTIIDQRCYTMMLDLTHCYQFLAPGQCRWANLKAKIYSPYYQ